MPRPKGSKNSKKGKKGGMAVANHQRVNPMAAGVMGAVAGAAVGATAAVILSSENTRKKITEVVDTLSKQTPDMVGKADKRVHEMSGKAADVMDKANKKLQEPTPMQGTKSSQKEEKAKD